MKLQFELRDSKMFPIQDQQESKKWSVSFFMETVTSKFLWISGVCAIAAPILLLTIDAFHIITGQDFIWTIGMWLAFALFIPAVIGIAYCLAASGSQLAYLGGVLAFFGAMAGASMQVLFRTHAVLGEQGLENVNQQLRGTFKLVASTQMIGLTWPLGLLMLSVAVFATDRSKWLISLALAAGAIAFPIGRIAFVQPAVILSGVFFVVGFGLLGKEMLMRTER